MGHKGRFRSLKRLSALALGFAYTAGLGLVLYEMTAKSPALLGDPLPGWWATVKAEKNTRWNPPTGILPVDKLLHEGEEALRFYRILSLPPEAKPPVSAAVS